MKFLNLSIVFTLFYFVTNAQDFANKISLDKDKEYEIVSTTKYSGNLDGVAITITSDVTTKSKVFNVSDENYKIKTKIVKMKAYGEANGTKALMFDSENSKDQNSNLSADLNDIINIEKELSLNRKNGTIKNLSSPEKDMDIEAMENLMNVDGSETASVNEMFLLIPNDKKPGDSWTISIDKKKYKTEIIYTITELKGEIAYVNFKSIINYKQTLNEGGMDTFTHIQINSHGTIEVSAKTGILQKKTSDFILEGANEVMGSSSPIKINSSNVTTYHQK